MCASTQLENEFGSSVFPACAMPQVENDNIGDQVLDFLDGRTHGEDLLHRLYDYVIEEPVPDRMRALFRAGQAAGRQKTSTQG